MEDQINLYRALDAEWARVGPSAEARRALARWTVDDPVLAGFSTPAAIVSFCRGRTDPDRANRLVAALLHHGAEPLAARTVLQVVLPGLAAQVRRRTRHAAEFHRDSAVSWEAVEDLDGEVVLTALEQIARLAGSRPERPAQAIIDPAWTRLREGARRRERRGRIPMVPLEDDHEAMSARDVTVADELAAVIVNAVRGGTLRAGDAAVVYTTRVMGRPLPELAAAQGRDVRAVRLQRSRAERALVQRC